MGFVKDAFNGITGKTSAKAAKQAGQMQSDASKYAADVSQRQFEQTRLDQMPWLNAGANALGKLQDYTNNNTQYKDPYGNAVNQALGGIGGNVSAGNPYKGAYDAQLNNMLGSINPNGNITAQSVNSQSVASGNIAANNNFQVDKFSDKMQGTIDRNYKAGKYTGGLSLDNFEADPGYEFRKQQGMDGIQSSAAASGGLLSGAALKALNQHNSNLASQEYNNAWQRDQMQKQQQYGVDTGLLGQNYNMFADQQNRRLQADITGATMNQQANMFNTTNDLNSQLANQSADLNAQMTNVNNSMAAQSANQNYGLSALQSLMAAKGQDYGIYSDQQDRNMQAQQFNIGNQYNALNALMNARTQDYNMFNNEDARLFNQLANLAGVGQQTATNLGSFGAANAQNQGNAAISGAGAQAMGLTGAAAAKGSAWNNLLGLGLKAAGFI